MHLVNLRRLAPVLIIVLLSACNSWPKAVSQDTDVHRNFRTADSTGYPTFEHRFETEHFVLHWTNRSSHSKDNIKDPEIIKETAAYLETAWDKLTALFGRIPYTANGSGKIAVIFRDLECYAFADPPDGPIEFNSSVWTRMPSIRKSTSAHELFHKLQYAYGYRTRWFAEEPYLWFTEGTAAWAEVFVWGRVSRNCKMQDMFKDKSLSVFEAEDMALPFWIYFVSGNRNTPKDELMARFLERCERTEDVKEALFRTIQDAYGSVDGFFRSFDTERRKGFWGEPAPDCYPYTCIVGPDGRNLIAEIKRHQGMDERSPVQSMLER